MSNLDLGTEGLARPAWCVCGWFAGHEMRLLDFEGPRLEVLAPP